MIRIKIPAMRATIGWNAGWNGISTLRMGKKSLFWESIQPYTVVPHNFAFRVGTDASQGEKGLKTVRERPVGADDLLAAWHGSTCLRDCLYLLVLYDTRGCLEASEKRA